jgi:hypothetical protein
VASVTLSKSELLFICDFFRFLKRLIFEHFHFKSSEKKKVKKIVIVVGFLFLLIAIPFQSSQSPIFKLQTH